MPERPTSGAVTSASGRANAGSRPPRAGAPLNPNPTSRLTAEQTALVGVARWPDPKHNNEQHPDQQDYGRAFSAESTRLGGAIGRGEIGDLDQLWKACRDWRVGQVSNRVNATAEALSEARTSKPSGGIPITPMLGQGGRYEFIHDRMAGLAPSVLVGEPGMPAGVRIDEKVGAFKMQTVQQSTVIDGQTIPLTSLHAYRDPTHNEKLERNIGSRKEPLVGQMIHTDAASVEALVKEAGSVFKAVQAPGLGEAEKLAGLAKMHWLLAHAMQDSRGSAAKAELAVRATAHALNMELPPFKHGIQPDIESFLRTEQEFVADYKNLLEDPATSPRSAAWLRATAASADEQHLWNARPEPTPPPRQFSASEVRDARQLAMRELDAEARPPLPPLRTLPPKPSVDELHDALSSP